MVPPLFAGSVSVLLALLAPGWEFLQPSSLPAFWLLLYGCALTAAGFFLQRGIKLLGWLFLLGGCGLMAARCQTGSALTLAQAHGVMGATFGGLHLAYGVYLYFTEPRGNET
jgi:hypothetical protein